eukprot:TRINITY_DN12136_c0_g1_i1.p1 TRINITY_DN12136_c0_g1~~TRINITY_DN12136_c0_g1_i1.p1  ORF type:complete len:158 (-),score=46.80 TRINITY_DN12136_c0_g1_i1:35-508(-)
METDNNNLAQQAESQVLGDFGDDGLQLPFIIDPVQYVLNTEVVGVGVLTLGADCVVFETEVTSQQFPYSSFIFHAIDDNGIYCQTSNNDEVWFQPQQNDTFTRNNMFSAFSKGALLNPDPEGDSGDDDMLYFNQEEIYGNNDNFPSMDPDILNEFLG